MIRKMFVFSTILVVASVWGTNALAQGPSPALDEALSRIRTGMASSGVKWFSFDSESGRKIEIRKFEPLSLAGCSVRIHMTHEDTGSALYPNHYVFNVVWTIPLGQLDFKKISVSYQPGWSKSAIIERDWEMGYFSVTIPSIKGQRAISGVGNIRSYNNALKSSPPRSVNLDTVDIFFKDKKDAEGAAIAFVQASRLCSTAAHKGP